MATNAPSSPVPTPFLPTPEQTALAIAILRAKPGAISVRDYILQLRRQIKRGRNPCETEDPGHYIDLVAYWQQQCRQAQDECDRLRTINIKLERCNQQLTGGTTFTPDHGPVTPTPKRKVTPASPTRSPKRPRIMQQMTAEQSSVAAQNTIENDADFLEVLGDKGTSLTEAIFTTHNLCRASETDGEALCASLVRTASAFGKVIQVVAQNYEQLSRQGTRTQGAMSLDQDKSDFAIALSICARAFMSILVGANKLSTSDADQRLPSLVVCELADMFRTALSSIESSARSTAQAFHSQPPPSKKGKAKVLPSVKESVPARAVAHLLISFLGFLEKTDPVHQKIFDGFAFILFERVGKRLYYCTFGRSRSNNIERNILPVPEPKDAAESARRETDALAIRLEVKALVLILERAMGLAPNHMNPQTARPSKSPNRLERTLSLKSLTTTSRARLSSLAKERLQRTLVACMYERKVNDEFMDVLTKPMPSMRLGSLSNVAKIEDKDVESWYKEEVWRLVGWDILARESGW